MQRNDMMLCYWNTMHFWKTRLGNLFIFQTTKKTVKCKWIFRTKLNQISSIKKYKALTSTSNEVLWIKRLLVKLNVLKFEDISLILNENILAQILASKSIFCASNNHVESGTTVCKRESSIHGEWACKI